MNFRKGLKKTQRMKNEIDAENQAYLLLQNNNLKC